MTDLNHDVIKWQRALYCSSITNNSNSENKICYSCAKLDPNQNYIIHRISAPDMFTCDTFKAIVLEELKKYNQN